MKIILISSSPHREKSNTFILAREVLRGCVDQDLKSETIHLCDLSMHFCRHCEECHKKLMNCSIKDDVDPLIKKMLDSEGIIFASPNYINHITASMKTLFERACHILHCKRLLGKYAVSVVSSGSGQNTDVTDYIRFYAYACGAQYSGEVSVAVPLGDESLQEAYNLGKRLASDIKEKKGYPDQVEYIEKGKRYFAEIIKARKDVWKEEYRYWQEKGWL